MIVSIKFQGHSNLDFEMPSRNMQHLDSACACVTNLTASIDSLLFSKLDFITYWTECMCIYVWGRTRFCKWNFTWHCKAWNTLTFEFQECKTYLQQTNKQINEPSIMDYVSGIILYLGYVFSMLLFKMSSSNTLDLQCQEMIFSLDAMECPPMIGEC